MHTFEEVMFIEIIKVFTVIFLAIKPTPVTGVVPKAKKYVFSPIEAKKIPK